MSSSDVVYLVYNLMATWLQVAYNFNFLSIQEKYNFEKKKILLPKYISENKR